MKRTLLAFIAAGATHSLAQTPTVHYELSYTPFPSNNFWKLLYFTDYAQISLTARIEPPVGTIITLPDNTTGTIAGLASLWFDLRACNAGPAWTLTGQGFQGTTGTTWGFRSGWFGLVGATLSDGTLDNIQVGQFFGPGIAPNPTNPVAEIWRGKWIPQNFLPGRHTRFTIEPVETRVAVRAGFVQGEPNYIAIPANPVIASVQVIQDPGSPGPCFAGFPQGPANQTVLPGETAVFFIPPPLGTCGVRWYRNCVPLSDGGNISGALTNTLAISNVSAADAGVYELSVGGYLSTGGILTIGCYANCDHSTAFPSLTANDFACFLDRFAAADNYANCDGVGGLTANDFACFLNRFAAGCS